MSPPVVTSLILRKLIMSRPKTISQEYRRMNKELHKAPKGFGAGGGRHVTAVALLAMEVGAKTFLDYGAGQQLLSRGLVSTYPVLFDQMQDYDPAIKEISGDPLPADLVACTDVLEHIEPQYLDNVLRDIFDLTQKAAYLEIATRPANKKLPDGRNAHLIIQYGDWWQEKLSAFDWNLDIEKITHPDKTPQLRAIVVRARKQ